MAKYINTLSQGSTLHGKSYNYCIEKVLGQGTFGITYLASVKMQGALGSIDAKIKVAVKEFFMKEINGREGTTVTSGSKGGLFADYRKKFIREATNLSKLQHPNIIKVLECFEANNTVYYTMEYLDGGSLDELITKKHGLSEAEAVRFAHQIANALSYMHEHKVLHLDLKPGNIMLCNGNAVLIDFGLSKQYDASGNPESSTTVGAGTPGYAPIEQANYRDGKGFPVRMDIYSLGATMYKMLTGQRPPDASEVLNDGLPDKPAFVSSEVWAAVEAAMEPMLKLRPQRVGIWIKMLPEVTAIFNNVEVTVVGVENSTRNMHNGHEWVDLGLSVMWATCNIGSEKPEECGCYFAWGETHTKSNYTKENSKTFYKKIGDIACNLQYDAAQVNWGGEWHLPSESEFDELYYRCEWIWTTINSKNGYIIKGPNGNTMFLPAAGLYKGEIKEYLNEKGCYWSSTPYEDNDDDAYYLFFAANDVDTYSDPRYVGIPIRAVINSETTESFYSRGLMSFDDHRYEDAMNYFQFAAKNGDINSLYQIGYLYEMGLGFEKNAEEAVIWYKKAAEFCNADAQLRLGYCFGTGNGVEQNCQEAFMWYQKSAKQGNPDAQYNLGVCYFKGVGVKQDYFEAARWYRKAAEQGVGDAMFQIGCCFEGGQGVASNYEEAVKWYLKAAGDYGIKGAESKLDCQRAINMLYSLAEKGYIDAQYYLGTFYRYGEHVNSNEVESIKWLRLAAENGDERAQKELSECYRYGWGVAKDLNEAIKWCRKVANQGNPAAQFTLSLLELDLLK